MVWRTRRKKKGKFVFVFLIVIAGILLLVGLVQYLWNLLLPDIFGLKTISYWQALGLFVLSKILFGGAFRKPGEGFKRRISAEAGFSDEDKERLKAEWRKRFGGGCH